MWLVLKIEYFILIQHILIVGYKSHQCIKQSNKTLIFIIKENMSNVTSMLIL